MPLFGFLPCMLEKTRDLVLENEQRETSIKWVGRPERGACLGGGHYHSHVSCRKNCQLQTSTEESMTFHSRRISSRKESSIIGPKGERFTLHPSCKKSATPASQPMRQSLSRAHTFCNGLPFKTSPPSFLHFLHKITLLSFVCWAYLGFWHNLFIQNSYSLLFPNKPFFFFFW